MTTNKNVSTAEPTKGQLVQPKYAIPKEILNLVPHVIEDFCRLRRRFKRKLTKSDRLWSSTEGFKKKGVTLKTDKYKRKIEIEIIKEPTSQSEKIALPIKRHLTSLKEHKVYPDFSKERKTRVNKLLVEKKEKINEKKGSRKTSLLEPSYQIQHLCDSPLKGKETSEKTNLIGTKNQGRQQATMRTFPQPGARNYGTLATTYNTRITSGDSKNSALMNAKKKSPYQNNILEINRQKQNEIFQQEFFNRLSSPKYLRKSSSAPSWRLTKSMQNFKPSDRLVAMAQPKVVYSNPSLTDVLKVKKAALHYKASNRILELALPTSLPDRNQIDPYQIPESALRATITDRIVQLARPKDRSDRTIRKHPFKVSRRALNAKPSKHIRDLAQPKLSLYRQEN